MLGGVIFLGALIMIVALFQTFVDFIRIRSRANYRGNDRSEEPEELVATNSSSD
jgi:hypothetical protein